MYPQESLANVEIYCSSETETRTFYVHDFLLKFRWRSLYTKLSRDNLKVQVRVEPKLLSLILEFIYSGELVLNHLSVKELLDLLDFTVKQDIELIVSLVLNHLLLSTPINDHQLMNSGVNTILSRESEKEKENKNHKLSSNLEKLKIATKIQILLQEKKLKSPSEESEKRASELFWEKIHIPQEKTIQNFYQDLQKIYYDQTLTNFKIQTQNGQEFPVHLPILIARSHYFQAINQMQMNEINSGRLKVQNISETQTFEKLLKYFYMGFYSIKENSNFDHHEALGLLKMANYFDLKTSSLNLLMENYIMEAITQNSCLEILDLSDKMNFYQLKMKSLDFICRNYKGIIKTNLKTFEQFPKTLLIEIMEHLANYTS